MTDSSSRPRFSAELTASQVIFLLTLIVSLWYARAGWNNALLDTHPFRQTQTAVSAYWMIRDGFRLDYATPVLGPPWSVPMEFPLYQAAVAGTCQLTGMPLDQAGRAVSLLFFYAALPAAWLLLRRLGVSAAHRWLGLALVLTCPVYQFFSRAFLIESTAFCLSLWFLYCFHVGLTTGRRGALAAAAGFGVAAGLAKVTTLAVFLAPATAFAVAELWAHRATARSLLIRSAVAIGPGLVAAVAWIRYADALKHKNILARMIISGEMHDWNYGPLSQRFDPAFWRQFGVQLERAVFPGYSLALGAALALLFLRGRGRLFAVLVLVAMAGPLVFANLYFVHDYYLYSSGLFFLLLLALPLQRLMETATIPLAARLGVVLAVLMAQFSGYLEKYFESQARVPGGPPELALAIGRVTRPDDVLVGFGLDWNPVLPYYSGRRAIMVPNHFIENSAAIHEAVRRLRPVQPAAVIFFRLGQPGPDYFAPWLKELEMDENPFLQTGEYTVHLRKDRLPEALRALKDHPLGAVLLYQGQLSRPGEQPRVLYWTETVKDRSLFAGLSPVPVKVTVPFGLSTELIEGQRVFNAHATTEIEILPPPGARHITAEFGINPAAYDRSDGVDFEVVSAQANGLQQRLFFRSMQPSTIMQDRGRQTFSVETVAPLQGRVLFRTLPGPSGVANFDWAYWGKIKVD
ncbi:MAG: hypothetical protein NT173_12055 [Opitutales bacterium]|nr:hypothetical protein [Opitutales bacterium]